jgi:hypothetical protein
MANSAAVASAAALRARLAQRWPVSLDDAAVLTLGMACTMSHSDEVIELTCSRALAPVVKRAKADLALNADEFTALLAGVAARGVAPGAARGDEFDARRARVERALACTLAEQGGARLWARPAVQIAAVLSFHAPSSPFATLDALFGSVVRADVRRAEDLHVEETAAPMSVMLLTRLLEAVASAALA